VTVVLKNRNCGRNAAQYLCAAARQTISLAVTMWVTGKKIQWLVVADYRVIFPAE